MSENDGRVFWGDGEIDGENARLNLSFAVSTGLRCTTV